MELKKKATKVSSNLPIKSVRGEVERRITRSMSRDKNTLSSAKMVKTSFPVAAKTRSSNRTRGMLRERQMLERKRMLIDAEHTKTLHRINNRETPPLTRSQSRKRNQPKVKPVKNVSGNIQGAAEATADQMSKVKGKHCQDAVMSKS